MTPIKNKRQGLFLVVALLFLSFTGCNLEHIKPMSPVGKKKVDQPDPNKMRKISKPAQPQHVPVQPSKSSKSSTTLLPPATKYGLIGSFSTGEYSYVRDIFTDDDAMWIGTTEGIIQVDTRTGDLIKTFSMKDVLLSPYIFTINKSPDGKYWFGTNNGGLSLFNGQAWKSYLPSDGLADFWVYGIDFAKDGTAWIATWNGVSQFDGKTFKNYNTVDGLADRWVYALSIDKNGDIWFGTEGGVSRLDRQGKWTTWKHKDGLGAPNRFGLSKSDNTGFGTQLNPQKEEDYKHQHNLSVLDPGGNETYNENYVFSMAIDQSGNKWFGTWGGGVSRFNGETWKNYTTAEGLAGNIVYDVTVDPFDGALWFGTNHGVSRFDGTRWTNLTLEDGLANENVYAVAIDRHRRIWLGEKGGVDVWAPQKQ